MWANRVYIYSVGKFGFESASSNVKECGCQTAKEWTLKPQMKINRQAIAQQTPAAPAIAAAVALQGVGGGRFGRYTRRHGSGPRLGPLFLDIH
jgi:hypothetical protein